MNRISMKELEASASLLSMVTGQAFQVRNAYGSVGLDYMAQGGRVDRHETMLMTKGQLHAAIGYMLKGAYAMRGDI